MKRITVALPENVKVLMVFAVCSCGHAESLLSIVLGGFYAEFALMPFFCDYSAVDRGTTNSPSHMRYTGWF